MTEEGKEGEEEKDYDKEISDMLNKMMTSKALDALEEEAQKGISKNIDIGLTMEDEVMVKIIQQKITQVCDGRRLTDAAFYHIVFINGLVDLFIKLEHGSHQHKGDDDGEKKPTGPMFA